mgnify:CR=1 FL=1
MTARLNLIDSIFLEKKTKKDILQYLRDLNEVYRYIIQDEYPDQSLQELEQREAKFHAKNFLPNSFLMKVYSLPDCPYFNKKSVARTIKKSALSGLTITHAMALLTENG